MFHPSSADAGPTATGRWLLGTLDREFALFEHLLRYGKNQSRCTIANHGVAYKNLRTFLTATVGETGELPDHLFDPLAWLAWNRMKTKRPGEASVHTYWSKNRTFFRFLVDKHGIANPFAKAKAPTLPARVPKARTPAECGRILDAAEHRNWPSEFERYRAVAMLATILFAGLRRREVLQLKRMHVDFDQQTINIEKGKGRGGGKQRITFIAPELDRVLRRYVRLRDQLSSALSHFGRILGESFSSTFEASSEEINQILRLAVTAWEIVDEHHLYVGRCEYRFTDLKSLAC